MAGSSSTPSPTGAGASQSALRILIDTNVMLDLVLAREPWATEARPVWDARDAGLVATHLLASVVSDIYYITRKQVGAERARAAVAECLTRCILIGVDQVVIDAALTLSGPDFEDHIQIAGATAVGLDFIVTRNVADFAHSPIAAVTPAELIRRLPSAPTQ